MKPWKRKKIIGRTDCVDFPELKLKEVSVKVDTGAYTSSLHCHEIKEIKKGTKRAIHFVPLDPSHEQFRKKIIQTDDYEIRSVRNSFGMDEERFVIKTKIKLFSELIDIELSLTDRSDMKYPILLGRKVLADLFVVDVSKTNMSFKSKRKK